MKQIIQNYRTGELELAEVPIPLCSSNKVLIKNHASLISIGTERSIIELGKKSLLGKAKSRPDLVKRFMEKAKKEGLVKTFKEAIGRLDEPTPLGYSSSGTVIGVGNNIHKYSPGERVACIGAGFACHADYVTIPENLCCKMPDNLSFEEASFGMLGIIALNGIRCANLTFGESVAVIGLGLLGLLTIKILTAYGCSVIGIDIDQGKVDFAKKIGIEYVYETAEDFKNAVERATNGFGVDAVILAVATKSNEPVNTAVEIVRHNGKIVIVGVTDIHPERNEMWHKQVDIMVSKAGGAGIFDPLYENKGIDYPVGYVRWTENRNLEEFLKLISTGKVDVKKLISHKHKIDFATDVYKNMLDDNGGPYVGVMLEYPEHNKKVFDNGSTYKNLEKKVIPKSTLSYGISLGVIGAGLFGKALLLPALKSAVKSKTVKLHTISTSSSENAYHIGKKYNFENFNTNYVDSLDNKEINAVIILTPHSLHAKMVIEALKAGKSVFVEKPLCVKEEELKQIISTYSLFCDQSSPILSVGYNRRFSLHAEKIKVFLKHRQDPLVINYRINSGFVPADHWVHSEEEGGSRIIGEICHFVDFIQFVTGSDPFKVHAERISGNNSTALNSDNVVIVIKFTDGSVGNIVYSASGNRAYSRESIEIFFEGNVIVVKDFKETVFYRNGKKITYKTHNQEMGYKEELIQFFDLLKGEISCKLSVREIFLSTLTVFKINESLMTGNPSGILLENL